MAITIIQQPTTPNCTYTNLVYEVSSSRSTDPQFQYIMDVYVSGSVDRLARVRQFPNQYNKAVFDPSRIFNDNMEYVKDFTNNYLLTGSTQVRDFSVEFGEEFGTSVTSSVVISASLATDIIQVFPCQIDPNNGTSYNYLDSASAVILSDRPNNFTEYQNVNDRFAVYNGTGINQDITWTYSAGLGGPYTETVTPGEFEKVKSPVQNQSSGTVTITFGSDTIIKNYEAACDEPVYNFHFINKYGMFENFSTNRPARINTNVTRQDYTQTFVNYGGNNPGYDVTRRGKGNFNTSLLDSYTISTNWLNQTEADWITQLIESDEVYLAVSPNNSVFKPIVITNTTYQQHTNRKDQKMFMYDITFEYANQRRGR